MPPKFTKSARYTQITQLAETEVLDQYECILESGLSPDVLLSHIPAILKKLRVPQCFTKDICQCIQWFYDTGHANVSTESPRWAIVEQLLLHLTISSKLNGVLQVSDIVDIDKLVTFCNRLLRFRDHYRIIRQAWSLFVEASGNKNVDVTTFRLSMKDLTKVKSYLQLDDISDTVLIDMLGCGTSTVEGDVYNYTFHHHGLSVNIKDFAEIMGQLGELD
ncbi:CIC11C00000002707 [Sungouiella intermedia]|uniref:CIC11C00000002707 n=1 Tax=Sungouiella intermedia TaxID=45354 RepID=A0A1L0DES7_9ASCO|nr:CIC11C00000002707 [[Candida] intermedia]